MYECNDAMSHGLIEPAFRSSLLRKVDIKVNHLDWKKWKQQSTKVRIKIDNPFMQNRNYNFQTFFQKLLEAY